METGRGLRGAGHIVQRWLRAERPRERSYMYLGPDHRKLPVDVGRSRGPSYQPPTGPSRWHIRVARHAHPGPNDQTLERDHW